MPWLKLSCGIAGEQFDTLADFLLLRGAVSVSSTASHSSAVSCYPILEPAPGAQPMWDLVQLQALLPLHSDLAGLKQQLQEYFEPQSPPVLAVTFVQDQDWSDTWREGLPDRLFAGRLRILPKDQKTRARPMSPLPKAEPGSDVAAVYLDPGLAFGSGTHPTTRLCLQWLACRDPARLAAARVVDYGCGCGVLALAALVLGAAHVIAVDYDPQALLATGENARFNGVDLSRLTISSPAGLTDAYEKPVDILLANILANPLRELATSLTQMVLPGGHLVLSGLLEDQVAGVSACYPAFDFLPFQVMDGWVCLEGRKHHG